MPCGSAAHKVLDGAGLDADARSSEEQNVKAVLTKVQTGDADAGLVYRTDVLAAGDTVEGVEFPEAPTAVNEYPIVVLATATRRRRTSRRRSSTSCCPTQGQKILTRPGVHRAVRRGAAQRRPAACSGCPRRSRPVCSCCRSSRSCVRADWSTLPADITTPAALDALAAVADHVGRRDGRRAWCSACPLAVVLARARGWSADVLRALVTLPLVLPPTVGGIALLYLLGRRGLVGQSLDTWFGITDPVHDGGRGHRADVRRDAVPRARRRGLAAHGRHAVRRRRREPRAPGRWTVLRRITLPLVMPGLVSGTVLCFARALGEFGATALFAGNSPGVTQTMPLAIYSAFNGAGVTQGTAVALSLLLVVAAVAVLLAARAWRPGRAA